MDIAALSTALSAIDLQSDIGMAVLNKALEQNDITCEGITKIMESSVLPDLGQNIDISI